MTQLILRGYISNEDDTRMILRGDNAKNFANLSSSYWAPGICRHVSKDKCECTIKTTDSTMYEKNKISCKRTNLDGCYCIVNARAKKYTFWSNGMQISGWQIIAASIKQTSPLCGS